MVIYCTTNLINGKKYIGKDVRNSPSYLGSGKLFLSAVKKYGKENFKKEIIAYTDDYKFLSELEIYYIDYYNAVNSDLFYNITSGGDGGITHDQSLKKVKIYQFDLNKNLIKVWDSAKDASDTLNIRRVNILKACKLGQSYKRFLWSKTNIYTNNTDNSKFKKIYQIDKNTNKLLKEWDCLQEIHDVLKFDKSNILVACNKPNRTSYGFRWTYFLLNNLKP